MTKPREYIDLPPNIPETLAAMHERLNAGTARIKRIEDVQNKMRDELAVNTAATAEILDVLAAARMGFKVLGGLGVAAKWVGILAGAALSIYTAIYAMTHGGATPK